MVNEQSIKMFFRAAPILPAQPIVDIRIRTENRFHESFVENRVLQQRIRRAKKILRARQYNNIIHFPQLAARIGRCRTGLQIVYSVEDV